MKTARYKSSRQKACQHCAAAKAKCERRTGGCTRCTMRGLSCSYASSSSCSASRGTQSDPSCPMQDLSTSSPPTSADTPERSAWACAIGLGQASSATDSTTVSSATSADGTRLQEQVLQSNDVASLAESPNVLDFGHLNLICPINVDEIGSRWLNPFIPVPGQKLKQYPPNIETFIYRIIGAYAAIATRGRGVPPFVHHTQTSATSARPPLSICLSLVRICEKLMPGSEEVAVGVLQKEISRIYEHHNTFDDITSLSALQAHLLYSLVMFFRLKDAAGQYIRSDFTNLQAAACTSSQRGLVCTAEQQNARPRWEEWIVAEAKRRTLYTMYMFDNVLSSYEGIPTFFGTELQGLPAPSSKILWEAKSRQQWETAYNAHLADWVAGGLRIDELWPPSPNMSETELISRRSRVDQWLEGIDEFGTMLYAVSSSTHN